MKIGINTLYLVPGEVGGTETYVRNLLLALEQTDNENEYLIFTNKENHETFTLQTGNFKRRLCNISARNKFLRIAWEQLVFPFIKDLRDLDVLFSPGYVIPVLSRRHHVVAVHDMLFKRYPALISKAKLIFWNIFVPLSVRLSRCVITFSEFSKSDIEKYLHADGKNIVVTYGGMNQQLSGEVSSEQEFEVKRKYGIQSPYILSVATLSPHKNLLALLRALSILRNNNRIKPRLLLAGKEERAADALEQTIRELGLDDSVRVLGYIPAGDLAALYRMADCFILPSLMEGFGYPILEAMQLGCPVACSRSASLPEVAGDAALFFNPTSIEEIASALETFLTNKEKRDEYRDKGLQNVKRFSWEKTAHDTLRVFLSATRN